MTFSAGGRCFDTANQASSHFVAQLEHGELANLGPCIVRPMPRANADGSNTWAAFSVGGPNGPTCGVVLNRSLVLNEGGTVAEPCGDQIGAQLGLELAWLIGLSFLAMLCLVALKDGLK